MASDEAEPLLGHAAHLLPQESSSDDDDSFSDGVDLPPNTCEMRLDRSDGCCYTRKSFIQEYGSREGRRRWAAAAQPRPTAPTAPPAERGAGCKSTAHRLRLFILRSSQCKLCRLTGPSPQTGTAECALCRRCVSCCRRSPVCPLGDGAEPVPDAVCWGDGCGRLVRVTAGPPGHVVSWVSGHPPLRPSSRLSYMKASKCGAGVVLSDRLCVLLPVKGDSMSVTLRRLRALADAHGVVHDLPGGVDVAGHPLPRVVSLSRLGAVVACVVAPCTRRIATAHQDGSVQMWDMRTPQGSPLWRLKPDVGGTAEVRARFIDLSPCERYLAVGCHGSPVVDTRDGSVVMNCRHGSPKAVEFSPCGRYLLLLDEARVSVWGMADRTVLCFLSGIADQFAGDVAGAFSPSGGYVAVVAKAEGDDSSARVPALVSGWRQSFGEDAKLRRLPAATHRAEVVSLRFSADGRQLLSASADGLILVTDVASGDCVLSHSAAQELSSALFVGGGGAVAALCGARLRLWRNTELVADEPVTRGSRGLDIAGETVATGLPQGGVRLQPLPRVAGVPDWRRRVSHAHCGQRGLELLLLWQKRLKSMPPLPTGLMLARQLPPEVLKRLTEWLPAPSADELMSAQGQGYCAVM